MMPVLSRTRVEIRALQRMKSTSLSMCQLLLMSNLSNTLYSVCYSPDGTMVLGGCNGKYVCLYEVSQRILVKKFQVSHNRSLDGVVDKLNSKYITDAGAIDTIDDIENEDEMDVKDM